MIAVIPAAGAGTRLKPLTHTVPKPILHVAGKPIIGHILDRLVNCVDEIVVVVGYKKNAVMDYVERGYADKFKIKFVDQAEQKGLGHAVYITKDAVGDRPVMIVLGDMIFADNYAKMLALHEQSIKSHPDISGSIAVKEVDDPRRYGIVELEDGYINRLVEKPAHPTSNLAIAGVYIIEDAPLLYDCLGEITSEKSGNGGEYQLTDALQRMVDRGKKLLSFRVSDWYDCGRPDSLLEINKVLLSGMESRLEGKIKNSEIIDPVIIEKNCKVENSIIGPNVSIGEDSRIENSIIMDSIIGIKSELKNILLMDSLIGSYTKVCGKLHKIIVGENTEINLE
ncbi:MAG: hypothetical protein A7316_00875 [Candidatus Altiarchaeales archaeon WOR_SM1_86-2]|nr:MAG: hypothetical protein A7316_00875 [Candidatus Altiarchaeales archaeon WOR_SM1_86-2]